MAKKKRRIAVRIDMTPMVDIAFLLLIFYMASTQFKPSEARAVELPSSHSMIEMPDKDMVNITVTVNDSIFVDYIKKITMSIDGREIGTNARIVKHCESLDLVYVIQKARANIINKTNKRPFVVLKADRQSSFGIIDDIMSSLQENDLGRFLVLTDPESGAEII